MKGAMNAMDNDGGLRAWAKKYPSDRSLAGQKRTLSDGSVFNPSEYRKEQEAGTGQAIRESERAAQYLGRLWEGKSGKGERKYREGGRRR